ncbi:UNVERIFIED_CONTAM: hypothetical protein K2H54_042528 [Gekko kuhli]
MGKIKDVYLIRIQTKLKPHASPQAKSNFSNYKYAIETSIELNIMMWTHLTLPTCVIITCINLQSSSHMEDLSVSEYHNTCWGPQGMLLYFRPDELWFGEYYGGHYLSSGLLRDPSGQGPPNSFLLCIYGSQVRQQLVPYFAFYLKCVRTCAVPDDLKGRITYFALPILREGGE